MNKKLLIKTGTSNSKYAIHPEKGELDSVIKYTEDKIKKIHRHISENEVKLESMESHSDYDYMDLLRESTEGKKDHKKDLDLLVELLYKCKTTI